MILLLLRFDKWIDSDIRLKLNHSVVFFSGTRSMTVRFVDTRYFAAAALIWAAVTFSKGASNELI